MKKIILSALFLLITITICLGQDTLHIDKEVFFEKEMVLADIDSYGRMYICDTKGNIKRLDSLGKTEVLYSPSSPIVPTNFTTQNPNQIFVFYQELQEWVILNRFLTEIERYRVSEKIETNNQYGQVGFVRLLVPAPNNTLWFFDESDFSLKNYDVLNKQILSQTPLDLVLSNEEYPITHLQFYQGQIFLGVEQQGILVFDSFGNYKTTLEYPHWKSISFEKEAIFIVAENKIIKKSLYKNGLDEIPLEKNIISKLEYFFPYSLQFYALTKTKMYVYTTK
ncbi:hypothetical protein [Bernardetia sp.]|uniref:hypothetical protein n=1 Tax=Bernardetia sp. TaxID=1937974 RepID=UPI0025C6BE40|nr:hypothetical protein [Bernardetia sp.]